MKHSQSEASVAPPRGRIASLAAALWSRIRRLFKKPSTDNPNIYPFF